jgi:predicted MFS family arabinose efflux permease
MFVMVFIGGVFGSVEISAVAFADEIDRPGLAGPFLACYAGGSAVAGLLFGAVHWTVSARRRLLLGAAAMAVTVMTLPAVEQVPVLAVALFVAGLGIAPTLISAFSLVERLVPAGTVTEGLSWTITGLIVGFAASTWLSGRIVDDIGVSQAFGVAIGSGLCALVVCALTYRRLPR